MRLDEMNGREIKLASWFVDGKDETVFAVEGESFRISVENSGNAPYEGETLVWLIQEKDGIEYRRFNSRYVDTISWK